MNSLNQEQREAAEGSGVACLAGAGSGKTTVLVGHYLERLRQGLKPRQILAVTFSVEAAKGLRSRIVEALTTKEIIQEAESTSSISTIHGFCYNLINRFTPVKGILDGVPFSSIWEHHFSAWWKNQSREEIQWWLSRFHRREISAIARQLFGSHRSPITYSDLAESCVFRLRSLFTAVDADTVEAGYYRFNDLEAFALHYFVKQPEMTAALRKQYRAVLVDEFQDTSPSQWEIVKQVVGDEWKKLFVVGDPKQSIYAFRGADVGIFLEACQRLDEKVLSSCYRTPTALLEKINELSSRLFEGSEIPFHRSLSQLEGESAFRLLRFEENEGDSVALSIQQMIEVGTDPSEIALLFRVSDRIPIFAKALETKGIATDFRAGESPLTSYEALDILNFLKTLANPADPFLRASFLASSFSDVSLENPPTTVGEAFERLAKCRYWPQNESLLLFLFGNLPWDAPLDEGISLYEKWSKEKIRFESRKNQANAVRLMTVHSVKGLEFSHVFLPDLGRLSSKAYPTVRIRGGKIGMRYRKSDGSFESDSLYEELSEKAKKVETEEAHRLLYVALTRARFSLNLVLPRNTAAIPTASWGALLCEYLIPEEWKARKEKIGEPRKGAPLSPSSGLGRTLPPTTEPHEPPPSTE